MRSQYANANGNGDYAQLQRVWKNFRTEMRYSGGSRVDVAEQSVSEQKN